MPVQHEICDALGEDEGDAVGRHAKEQDGANAPKEKEPWVRAHKLTFGFGCVGVVAAVIAAVGLYAKFTEPEPKTTTSAVATNQTTMNGPVTIYNGVQPSLGKTSSEARPSTDLSLFKPGQCPADAGQAGYGPERELLPVDKLSPIPTFNLDKSSENIGDERGFYGVRDENEVNAGWDFNRGVEEGHTYRLRVYVHNSADDNDVARNTRLIVTLPSCTARRIGTNAIISASNASPREVWGGVNLYSDRPFAIHFVPGSLTYCNNFFTCKSGPSKAKLSEQDIFTSKGVALGYDTLNGVFPGDYKHSAYVSFLVQPYFYKKS